MSTVKTPLLSLDGAHLLYIVMMVLLFLQTACGLLQKGVTDSSSKDSIQN